MSPRLRPRPAMLTLLAALLLATAGCGEPQSRPQVPGGDVGLPQERITLLPGPRQQLYQRPAPYQDDTVAINTGKALFAAYNCIGCHAPEGAGGMGPPLRDAEWKYGSDPQSVYETILKGRPDGMPTWQGKIPEDEVWKLVAYVRSLAPPPVTTKIPPLRGAEGDTTTGVANDTTPADTTR